MMQGTRSETIAALTGCPLDVLVIGGGIVGAGIARDAAMRGLRVGLVEQHDFAFGTSGRSSRLLHGGIRYLAQGRLGLVRQASREKKILHKIAPHLARPLPFTFPAYKNNPHWRLWQLKAGVKLYDLLCGGKNFGPSAWLKAREVLRRCPYLNPMWLKGAVRYYDGFTNDARLTLDTLRSAARHGACLVNYCRFENAQPGRAAPNAFGAAQSQTSAEVFPAHPVRPVSPLWVCNLQDIFAGNTFEARACAIVNATGPWAGGLPHSKVKLRLTKGVHIVVPGERLFSTQPCPLDGSSKRELAPSPRKGRPRRGVALEMASSPQPSPPEEERERGRQLEGERVHGFGAREEHVENLTSALVMTEGARILFAIPWGERMILGTTDTDYTGPLDDVHADAADIQYVLRVANDFFPGAQLTGGDIISTWAGLRPLLADRHGNPSDISRAHQIHSPEPGWWDVAGGKLTTYRLIAEQTVDRIVKWLERAVPVHEPDAEARPRLMNLVAGFPDEQGKPASSPLPSPPEEERENRRRRSAGGLRRSFRCCRTAEEPLLPCEETEGLSGILPPEFQKRVVEHYVTREWALHLDDVMVRRTGWHHYYTERAAMAERVADWMGELLGWSAETRAGELERYSQA